MSIHTIDTPGETAYRVDKAVNENYSRIFASGKYLNCQSVTQSSKYAVSYVLYGRR